MRPQAASFAAAADAGTGEEKPVSAKGRRAKKGKAKKGATARGGAQTEGAGGGDDEFSRATEEAAAGAQFAADSAKQAASQARGAFASLTSGFSLGSIASAAREEFEAVFLSPEEGVARKREGIDPKAAAANPDAGSALVQSSRPKSTFERLRDAATDNEYVSRVRSSDAYRSAAGKVSDFTNDMRERWETSDNAVVHRIQDYWDSMSTETEKAQAQRIAREREPGLSFPNLVAEIRSQIPHVLAAHATGDLSAIEQYCAPEMIERLTAEKAALEAQKSSWDPQVLDVHDVSLFDVKLIEDDPIVVVHFVAQQLYCLRDAQGNVVEGAEDDIREFYYAFVYVQGETQEYHEETGEALPRWKLLFMALQGTQQLVS